MTTTDLTSAVCKSINSMYRPGMLLNLRSPLMPLPPGSPVDQDGPEFPLMSSPGEPWGSR